MAFASKCFVLGSYKIPLKIDVEKVNTLKDKYNVIKGIQGMGLMLGISFNMEPKEFVAKCFDKGLLLVGAGHNVVRLVPPLNVTMEELDAALKIMEEALEELDNQ